MFGRGMAANPLLQLCLLTEGDPAQLTGGYLYHRRMAAAAPEHQAKLDFVSIPRRPFPLATGDARRRLRQLESVDGILLDSIIAGVAAPWIGRLADGKRMIGVIHQQPGGVDYGPLRSRLQARFDLLAYRQIAGLIAASDYLADRLHRQGLPASRITVVPPGRDPAEGQPPVPAGDLRRGRKLGAICISNWTHNKGIHWLLDAIARLPPDTATLHLVGDMTAEPSYARRMAQRIAQNDLRDRIVTHGALTSVEVAGLLQAADVLVHPSLHEAYATVCAEAMAAGIAVVASRVDNLPYLLKDGVEGILTSPGDVEAIASALALLAADPERRMAIGRAAYARAATRPTWAQSADRFFATIRDRLTGK